ncbi:MAG: hypothetical protein WBG37_02265 [Desulfobacterales bacterium]
MAEKSFKQVCRCQKCGNEAEMTVTCQLEEVEIEQPDPPVVAEGKSAEPAGRQQPDRIKGQAVCAHCGNEAEMWVKPPESPS